MELALLRQVQALEAQLSQATATVAAVPSPVVNETPVCPPYNIYHQAQFCPNQPLSSFCPATSTRQQWNQGAQEYGGDWNYESIYRMGKMPLSDDQLIQCGMLPR
jgi:hypothetical protein